MLEDCFEICLLECLKVALFHCYIYLMVENLEFCLSNMSQNSLTLQYFVIPIHSPWLKKNFKFYFLECLRIANFTVSLHSYTFTIVEENFDI